MASKSFTQTGGDHGAQDVIRNVITFLKPDRSTCMVDNETSRGGKVEGTEDGGTISSPIVVARRPMSARREVFRRARSFLQDDLSKRSPCQRRSLRLQYQRRVHALHKRGNNGCKLCYPQCILEGRRDASSPAFRIAQSRNAVMVKHEASV